jgi:pyruvate/2-oxoglutarate dehydrogenase complex dihydrolipoamide dehydrogenase (E3) component
VEAVRPEVDLGRVMSVVQQAIDRVYRFETPEGLAGEGVDVHLGPARFLDAHSVLIGDQTCLRAKHFLVCTGARPVEPPITGLDDTPHWTYESVWQQTRLPERLLVIGGGPVGVELAQAFARLGSVVTLFERGDRVLRVADPEAAAVLARVLAGEGVQMRLNARIERVGAAGGQVAVSDTGQEVTGDALLVAVGRRPEVDGLDLEKAGVSYSQRGIQVDQQLRTTQRHIFACGDVIGSFQFTHYAAWQAAMAIRTMLFPGSSRGVREHVPWTVFTQPEVAQCGLAEAEARRRYPDADVRTSRWPLERLDRAVTDQDRDGFIKVVHRPDGELLGGQVVAARAGEIIAELALVMEHDVKLGDLAGTIHVYPTYALGIQQLASDVRVKSLQTSRLLKLARRLMGWPRRPA